MRPFFTLAFLSLAVSTNAQTTLFGLGDTGEGTYQLDTTTIQGAGSKFATAWVIVTQAPGSQGAKLGAAHMLVMYIMDCPGKTIQPLAWKAQSQGGSIVAEGVHGKEKRRIPQPDSMDERIIDTVCGWKRPSVDKASQELTAVECEKLGKVYEPGRLIGPKCADDHRDRPCSTEDLALIKDAEVSRATCAKRGDVWSEKATLCFKPGQFVGPPVCKR